MTTVSGSNLGDVLSEAFSIAKTLRFQQERIRQALVADPAKEERRQREFELSMDKFGVFPKGRGFKIA